MSEFHGSWFHAKDGWFFRRLSDGSVEIVKRNTAHDDDPIVAQGIFTVEDWASIVASVSGLGESGASFRICESLQRG